MRRALLVVAILGAIAPSPARAQSVGAFVYDSLEAHADWVARRGGGSATFGFVSITRDTDPAGGVDTMAQVGRVRCSSYDDRGSFIYSCKISARLLSLRASEFQGDTALRSARVIFTARGHKNVVEWRGKGERPDPSWSLHGGERALVIGVTLASPAKVRGRVLGERFSTTRKSAHARLVRVFSAGLLYEAPAGSLTVSGSSRAQAWRSLRRAVASL